MTLKSPVIRKIAQTAAALAALGSALTTILGKAPFVGTVSKITFIPKAGITGATAEARTYTVRNKGLSGVGTTSLGTLSFITAVNASAFVPKDATLSVVAGALEVAAGDVIAVTSLDTGSTGIADPGGKWIVEITRS